MLVRRSLILSGEHSVMGWMPCNEASGSHFGTDTPIAERFLNSNDSSRKYKIRRPQLQRFTLFFHVFKSHTSLQMSGIEKMMRAVLLDGECGDCHERVIEVKLGTTTPSCVCFSESGLRSSEQLQIKCVPSDAGW